MNASPHLSQLKINHSSVPPSQQYQSHKESTNSSVPQITYHSPPVSTQPMTKIPQLDSGLLLQGSLQPTINLELPLIQETRPPFKTTGLLCNKFKGGKDKVMLVLAIRPKRPRNATWFKEKAMLAEAQESGQILDEEKIAFLADPGILDGQAAQTTILNNVAFQTEDLDAYDSDYDDVSTAQAVLMANLSNYGSDVISEVPHSESYHNDMDNQSVYAMKVHMLTKQQVFYDDTYKQDLGYKNLFYHKKAQRIKPTLYDDSVISSQHAVILVIDDDDTLILEELNRLSEYFGKRFVLQQELSTEEAFWLQTSHLNTDQSNISPVKIKAPKVLPKVSLVNTSLKKLKYHLGQFDTVVKKRITPDAITKGEWGFEHTKVVFLNKIIPFLKTLKDIFNVFDKDLLNEVTEVQIVFNQMEAVVQ
ncbi:hypothetical protein Tco_1012443 [Tanacetum coccineum]